MTKEELRILSEAAREGAFQASLVALKPWLNTKEAAMYLGVSEDLIYKAVESGRLECGYARINAERRGKILIARENLDKFPKKDVCNVKIQALHGKASKNTNKSLLDKIIKEENQKAAPLGS